MLRTTLCLATWHPKRKAPVLLILMILGHSLAARAYLLSTAPLHQYRCHPAGMLHSSQGHQTLTAQTTMVTCLWMALCAAQSTVFGKLAGELMLADL
jgi:hypothetical protein